MNSTIINRSIYNLQKSIAPKLMEVGISTPKNIHHGNEQIIDKEENYEATTKPERRFPKAVKPPQKMTIKQA